MICKTPSQQPGYVRITFELPSCMWADHIFISGSFNDWSLSAMPMAQERDGVWRANVELPAGKRYEFRYLVDGRWQTDYHADGCAGNTYGSENSLLDLTIVVALPPREIFGGLVPDGHVSTTPHLPLPNESAMLPMQPTSQSHVELPRLRTRVAAA